VLEARVHRTRIKKVSAGELADPSQSLERRLIDDLALPVIDLNEPVNRAANLVPTMGIRNQVPQPPKSDNILADGEEKEIG
jgi:hypothetical protein